MPGESSFLDSSGSKVVPAPASDKAMVPDSASESGERSFFEGTEASVARRWMRDETLALIGIRSEMGVALRDSSAQGPLWEEVSRKMAQLGYRRSGEKCREKLENVYKYHKRAKDGRPSSTFHPADSKSKFYRSFDQLESPGANPAAALPISLQPSMVVPQPSNNFSPTPPPSTNPSYLPRDVSADSTSSSTYSDQDLQRQQDAGNVERENKSKRNKKKKRKRKKWGWMELFKKLMGEMVRKQEELQKKLLDVIDRRERERFVREETWRAQEVARIDHEHEMLARDRSAAAAKDNAVISFLQRIADQHHKNPSPQKKPGDGWRIDDNPAPNDRNPSLLQQTVVQFSGLVPPAAAVAEEATAPGGVGICLDTESVEKVKKSLGSSSRWPKEEIEALIKLRTNLDIKYIENAPKGPLWEEISAAMKKLGYNRNPKRCKEKWENINKYFKKVKESNKKRCKDSKTCPYFQLLDELYKQKAVGKNDGDSFFQSFLSKGNDDISLSAATPPLMVTPEQRWPPPDPPAPPLATFEQESGGDTEDDDGGENCEGQFEVVASKV